MPKTSEPCAQVSRGVRSTQGRSTQAFFRRLATPHVVPCHRARRVLHPTLRSNRTDEDYTERMKTTGRNDGCPCGSGKKYKKCHLPEDEAKRSAVLKALEEEAKAEAAKKAEEEGEEQGDDDKKGTAKDKRGRSRNQVKSGAQPKGSDSKQKNMPRRGAV